MYCSQCGTELQTKARFCQECGQSFASPIWNPHAAVNWSVFLSPAFGSYLQMRNWKTLGEPEKAASVERWLYVSLGVWVVHVLIAWYMAVEVAVKMSGPLNILFLFAWYFASGKKQCKYVEAKFGSRYTRKPWGMALLCALCTSSFLSISVPFTKGFVDGLMAEQNDEWSLQRR
jgi:hypothetical protein